MIKGKTKTEAEYRATEMDSSSSLKEFALDRRKYYKKYVLNEKVTDEEESKAATVGRVVETLLLEPDEFDNRFYMSSLASAPTGNMLLFVEALYKHTRDNTDSEGNVTMEFGEICKLAHKDSGYKWTLDKVLEKFVGTDNEIYYDEIRKVRTKGLTVVTTDDIHNAEKVVEELKINETTAPIVNLVSSDNYLVQNQLQIEGYEVDGLKLKSMMDKVIIDHKNKTIQCIDLKCVWAVENFYEEYYLYRKAYIQAYLYKEACKELKEQLGLEYYTVLNPQFLVCDSINYYRPLVYTLNPDDIDDAYFGFEHKGRKYQGVKDIIKDVKWAKKENIWNISRTNFLNNGIVNLKG